MENVVMDRRNDLWLREKKRSNKDLQEKTGRSSGISHRIHTGVEDTADFQSVAEVKKRRGR